MIELLNNEHQFAKTMEVISFWRYRHEAPLVRAFDMLQIADLKVDKKAIFAKRLKRTISIALKLRRFRDGKRRLKNMQDIGGCRAIVSSKKKIYQIVREFKKALKNAQKTKAPE